MTLGSCTGVVPANVARSDATSWMDPGAKSASQLLYVSDLGTFDVYVYQFPSLKLSGKLHGFDSPQGECGDASGNIWIADTKSNKVREYAHGGAKPIASLADPLGYPGGCAVDPSTGDLAVMNIADFSDAGAILIYKNARGTPQVYGNSNFFYFYFGGYDRNGNLYVSGATVRGGYLLGVLTRGGKSVSLVKVTGGTLYFPGTVAWVGTTLVLGDQRCNGRAGSCFYRLRVSGRTARIAGATPLRGSCDVVQAWVTPTRIVGGDDAAYCRNGRSSTDLWPYPAGGKPASSVPGPRVPIGAVLSVANGPSAAR
ncbi:MAG: hypothetical protein JO146_07880 [Candidatus Eremiobacteraeota bacterium]|nr:hypothetical protein [Candidatus Eremiobacteraeota bacterium]